MSNAGTVLERTGVLLVDGGQDTGTAVFSADRAYRYVLTRAWATGPPAVFVMLNPSKAGAVDNDPTVRRCVRYAQRWGAAGLVVLNLFAAVSTDPAALLTHPDPVGPGNDETIRAYLARPLAACVVAWGASKAVDLDGGARVRHVVEMIGHAGHEPACLAVTGAGHPGHPLRLPAAAALSRWVPA